MSTGSVTKLTTAAVYGRRLPVSKARVWENLFDWEHLPWLHRTSFAAIDLVEEREDGWHARVQLQPADAGSWSEIEVVAWKERDHYVTRTLDGPGQGTEIWTTLSGVSAHETDIQVEFKLVGVTQEQAEGLGAAYTRLYTRLWDEDEAMMVQRQSRLDERPGRRAADETPDPVSLGPLSALRERLPHVVHAPGGPWRVIEIDGSLTVHSAICPHLLGPLELAEQVSDCVVRCPWHGYRFDVRSGECLDADGYRLAPPPTLHVEAGTQEVWLQWNVA